MKNISMSTRNYSHLIFNKETKNQTLKKRQTIQQIVLKKKLYIRKRKLEPHLLLCTETNSKWIKDVSVKHDI